MLASVSIFVICHDPDDSVDIGDTESTDTSLGSDSQSRLEVLRTGKENLGLVLTEEDVVLQ